MAQDFFCEDDFFDIAQRVKGRVEDPLSLVVSDPAKVQIPDFDFSYKDARPKMAEYNHNDAGKGPELRALIASILSVVDAFGKVDADNITLAPSLTSASLNVLFALSLLRVKMIAIGTPCYYATRLQMDRLGFTANLIPTFEHEGFRLDPGRIPFDCNTLWVTHPIISLTKDFKFDDLQQWLRHQDAARPRYIIIDEAADCKSPARLDIEGLSSKGIEIIRMRSFFKQVNINGQRLAFLVSSKKISQHLAKEAWLSHGGLDRFSMGTVDWVADNQSGYDELKSKMLERCSLEHATLARFIRGSDVSLPVYENGYITSLRIDMREWPEFQSGGHELARERLIEALITSQILPTLAPSMYFAYEPGIERLRLGYLGATAVRERALGKILNHLPVRA